VDTCNLTTYVKNHQSSSIFWTNSYNYDWAAGPAPAGATACRVVRIRPHRRHQPEPNNPFQFLNGVSNGPVLVGKTISTVHNYSTPPNASGPNCKAGSTPCVDTDYSFISGQVKYNAGELFGSSIREYPGQVGLWLAPIWFDVHPVTGNNGQLTRWKEAPGRLFPVRRLEQQRLGLLRDTPARPGNNVVDGIRLLHGCRLSEYGLYLPARYLWRQPHGRCCIFLVQGGGSGVSRALGRLHRTSPDFSSSTLACYGSRPVRPYIRELGDGDRFSRNIRLPLASRLQIQLQHCDQAQAFALGPFF